MIQCSHEHWITTSLDIPRMSPSVAVITITHQIKVNMSCISKSLLVLARWRIICLREWIASDSFQRIPLLGEWTECTETFTEKICSFTGQQSELLQVNQIHGLFPCESNEWILPPVLKHLHSHWMIQWTHVLNESFYWRDSNVSLSLKEVFCPSPRLVGCK